MKNDIEVRLSYKFGDKKRNIRVSGEFDDENISLCAAVTEKNIIARIVSRIPVEIVKFSVTLPYVFDTDDKIFLNGWQSNTECCERDAFSKKSVISSASQRLAAQGDYSFKKYPDAKGAYHGWSYAYIRNDLTYKLFCSLNEKTGFTAITFDVKNSAVILEKETEGLVIDGEYSLMDAAIYEGSEDEVFSAWFSSLDVKRTSAEPMRGYTTKYSYYMDFDEQALDEDLSKISTEDYELYLIDEGYETAAGDWTFAETEKFPSAMKSAVDKTHEKGFKAGVWLSPFIADKSSRLYSEHPEWILKDENGKPVYAGRRKNAFILDFSVKSVRIHISRSVKAALDCGFDLLKLDDLYAACALPFGGKTRGEIMHEAMDFLRDCVQDKLILACGVPLESAFGKADYCRVSCDNSEKWAEKRGSREAASSLDALYSAVFRRQLNERGFLNETDAYSLTDPALKLTYEQRQSVSFVSNLAGEMVFLYDDTSKYSEDVLSLFIEDKRLLGARLSSAYCDENFLYITYIDDEEEEQTVLLDTKSGVLLSE